MALSITLNTAVRALIASQTAVDNAAHNISNVATPGYSRQRVHLAAIPPAYAADGLPRAGAGVEVLSIERVRDLFIDFQYRSQNQALGRFSARAQSLSRAELALGEPGEAGMRAALSRFFNVWRDLSNTPESGPARTAVIEAGRTLALTARRISSSFVELRNDANARLVQDVAEINQLTSEVASLNDQVVQLTIAGENTGDLRDRQAVATDRLSQLLDITYSELDHGRIDISLNGRQLVADDRAFAIYGDPGGALNYVTLKFVQDDVAVAVGDGEVRGLLDQRDIDLPSRIADLDTLIGQIITDVNTVHAAGFGLDGVGGRDFFTGAGASDISVDATVAADTNAVAAASTAAGVPGDALQAQALSDLQYSLSLSGGIATYDEFYESFVSQLGVAVRDASAQATAQQLVVEQLEQARQSVSGVNLDEEMVDLMRYQRAYEAATRLIRVIDEILDSLINRTI